MSVLTITSPVVHDLVRVLESVETDKGRFKAFRHYLATHPHLSRNNGVAEGFQILLLKTTSIHGAFKTLIDSLPESATHYITIKDMIWKHLIHDDGIGGASINDILQYLKDERPRDYIRVMRSIESQISKLKIAPLFAPIFR